MSNFFKLFQKLFTGSMQVLDRTTIGNFTISTVLTPDMGPETAILDVNGTYIVERYKTVEEAMLGHQIWASRIKHGMREIIHLKYDDNDKDQKVILED